MAAQKAAISFGLVHIPVALHTATQDNDIHFNQLRQEDLSGHPECLQLSEYRILPKADG